MKGSHWLSQWLLTQGCATAPHVIFVTLCYMWNLDNKDRLSTRVGCPSIKWVYSEAPFCRRCLNWRSGRMTGTGGRWQEQSFRQKRTPAPEDDQPADQVARPRCLGRRGCSLSLHQIDLSLFLSRREVCNTTRRGMRAIMSTGHPRRWWQRHAFAHAPPRLRSNTNRPKTDRTSLTTGCYRLTGRPALWRQRTTWRLGKDGVTTIAPAE